MHSMQLPAAGLRHAGGACRGKRAQLQCSPLSSQPHSPHRISTKSACHAARAPESQVARFEGSIPSEAVGAACTACERAFRTDNFVHSYIKDKALAGEATAAIIHHFLVEGNRASVLHLSMPDRAGFVVSFPIPNGRPSDLDSQPLLQRDPEGASGLLEHYLKFKPYQAQYLESNGPVMYIAFIGVDTAFQGQGIGTKLMGAVREEADKQGQHLYLEASSEGSRNLYSRLGFKEIAVILGPRGESGPRIYAMARQPNQK